MVNTRPMKTNYLDFDVFEQLFPFYFSFNQELEIVSYGNSIGQNIGQINGKKFHNVFEIIRPYSEGIPLIELINENKNANFLIKFKSKENFILRGNIYYNQSSNTYLFAGFPWFHSIEEFHLSGIDYKQLGSLDPTFDYLNLIHTHKLSINDILSVLEIYKKQKSELEKLSLIAEETTNAVIITNKENEIEWVNKGFEKTYGYSLKEIVGKVPNDFLSGPLTTEQSNYEVLDAIRRKQNRTIEVINYHKDGSHHWAKVQIQPIFDEDGNVIRYFSIEEDISERKKIEQELLESKKLLDYAFEASGDGVWKVMTGKNLSIEYFFSNAYKKIFGYDDGEVFDETTFQNNVDHHDFEEGTRKFFSLTKNNSVFIQDYQIRDKFGNEKHILSRGKAFEFSAGGTPLKIVGTISDITVLRTLELEALTTTNRLTKLIENLQTGILVEDSSRKIAIVNDEFCRIFNIPVKPIALIGMDCKNASEQSKSLFKNPDKFIEDIEINLKNKTTHIGHLLEMNDGRIFSRDYIPIFHEQNYLGHLWQYKDITEMVLREKSLENLFEKEKDLNELKTRFIRITSHELRTPLAAIMTNSELLQLILKRDAQASSTTNDYDIYLNRIIKEVQRMNQTLTELTVVGRIEEGVEAFVFQQGNIVAYIKEIVTDLFSPFSDGRELTVHTSDEKIDVYFCKRMLKHAIINILNNAFKYSSGKTSPILNLQKDKDCVIIEVQDFGIGIPPDEMNQVFTSFFRCSNAARIQGTGIGLMLTDYITKAHGGLIHIDSQINIGSTFTLKIPFINNSKKLLSCD